MPHGSAQVVRSLIEGRADINRRNTAGSTPLVLAITYNNSSIVHALIEGGVDLEEPTHTNTTPLTLARSMTLDRIAAAIEDALRNRRP